MKSDAANTVQKDEIAWENLCREALGTYISGNAGKAVQLWRKSIEVSDKFPTDDPRRCTALNNAGVMNCLDSRPEESEKTFRRTLEEWQKARAWTNVMEVNGTAKSSTFHHRLEVRHHNQFREHTRSRYADWIDGAESITAFNLGVLLVGMDRKSEGLEALKESLRLRELAFGIGNPELALILRALAGLSGSGDTSANYLERAKKSEANPTRSSLQRWENDRPHTMNDMRRLLGAICMTAMLSQQNFP